LKIIELKKRWFKQNVNSCYEFEDGPSTDKIFFRSQKHGFVPQVQGYLNVGILVLSGPFLLAFFLRLATLSWFFWISSLFCAFLSYGICLSHSLQIQFTFQNLQHISRNQNTVYLLYCFVIYHYLLFLTRPFYYSAFFMKYNFTFVTFSFLFVSFLFFFFFGQLIACFGPLFFVYTFVFLFYLSFSSLFTLAL